jgi:Asp-tRNA(Asn)/Glu-tRNA(Gln) amidotransferase A subunit family amidase
MTDPVIRIPSLVFGAASAAELAQLMRNGDLSVREVTQAVLDRAQGVADRLNPFSAILSGPALAEADRADAARRTSGEALPPLWGLPVAIKDLTPMTGQSWTSGSKAFRNRVADHDAIVVERLRAAGAIIVARTTTPEFASSGFTRNDLHGVTRNPHDPSRTPGGSSGGAGVAVATGTVPFAEGSDMGGSIRIPAAWCGVVGLKPSFGRVPFAYLASRFDTISHLGPLARSVSDARLFLRHVAGHHPADPFSLPGLWAEDGPARSLKGLRIAASADLGYVALDPVVRQGFADALARLAAAGAVVEEIDLGWTPAVHEAWGVQWNVTFATWYGELADRQPDDLTAPMREMIAAGRKTMAVDLMAVEGVRSAIWADLMQQFESFDCLVTPTMAMPPPPATEDDADHYHLLPDGRLFTTDLTCPFNLTSPCPAISIPSGSANGMPLGLQIITPPHSDDLALAIAAAAEAVFAG